jgi:hypothetical protein
MEAERVATTAPAEADRTSEERSAPDLVLLQRAPAEYVRRLSRAYGNRRVALALQRQPAPAAAASPIAKGYKAVSVQDARWQKVDDLLWRDKALAEGKDEVAAAATAREKGLARVRLMIANPGGRASPELGPPRGVGESYEDFYAREFRRSPHPSDPP